MDLSKNNKTTFDTGTTYYTPPPRLLSLIMQRITEEKRKLAKIRFSAFIITSLIALLGFIPLFSFFKSEFYHSSFYQISSLLFSDPGVVVTYWQDFFLSLAESIPLFGITTFLILLFIFLSSARAVISETPSMAKMPRTA